MTALKAKEKGIDFVSVHDSYWTHASDVSVVTVPPLARRFTSHLVSTYLLTCLSLPFAPSFLIRMQVDDLGDLLRESFVELHSKPLLEDLEASFKARHPTLEFPPMPKRGDLDIEKVRESIYFFS